MNTLINKSPGFIIKKLLKYLIPFLLMPGLVLAGVIAENGTHYAVAATLMSILSFVLFLTGFERKKQGHRRLVIVALMTALAVTGRFIPLFKPVAAIVILTAMHLGPEAGFLTGALCLLISNMYFGQGPWTPFQMLSMGYIGFISGLLSEILKKRRWLLLLFGLFCGVLYSMIMDIWTVSWANGTFEAAPYLAALFSAIPFTVSYAFSNLLFLFLLAKPIGEKLNRIKIKYGV